MQLSGQPTLRDVRRRLRVGATAQSHYTWAWDRNSNEILWLFNSSFSLLSSPSYPLFLLCYFSSDLLLPNRQVTLDVSMDCRVPVLQCGAYNSLLCSGTQRLFQRIMSSLLADKLIPQCKDRAPARKLMEIVAISYCISWWGLRKMWPWQIANSRKQRKQWAGLNIYNVVLSSRDLIRTELDRQQKERAEGLQNCWKSGSKHS